MPIRGQGRHVSGNPVMRMPEPVTLWRRLMVMSTDVSASTAAELRIGPA